MADTPPVVKSKTPRDVTPAEPNTSRRTYIRIVLPLVLATVVFALDRASKVWIENRLHMHHAESVFGDYVRLVLWYNHGAAFGITLGDAWVHIALSIGAMLLVGYMVWTTPDHDRMSFAGFGMILGGAVGNLYDRIAAGKVTDFIDIGIGSLRWPTFNIADSAVVAGIGLLLLAYVLSLRDSAKHEPDGTGDSGEAAPVGATHGKETSSDEPDDVSRPNQT